METSFYVILQLLIPLAAVHKINTDLQQPDTLTIAKGQSISLHCSYSMHCLSRFTVKWFFRNDSQYSSIIIANLSTDKPYVSHSRYCVRHNSTLKAFILTIIDVQVSDNGIYCCEVIRFGPPPTLKAEGSGTRLNVTACPSLWLLEPYDKISSSPSIIITCLAYGFYPNIITFWIQPTCLTYRLISTSNPTNPNGTYNYTETFSISTENCSNSSEFTCIVQHPASQTELNGAIIIDVHTVAQDHKWRTWISILLSISGGTACLFLLVLFLIKCACKRKGIQEQTRIQSNRTLNLEWNNMNETNEEEICYAKLQWAMTRRARKEEEEETVYSPVLR